MNTLLLLLLSSLTQAHRLVYPITTHRVPTGEPLKRVIQSVNKFSTRFHNILESEDSDVVYSPVAIFTALGILKRGSEAATSSELAHALSLSKLNDSVVDNGVSLLIDSMQDPDSPVRVTQTTRLFLDHAFHPSESYVNDLSDKYSSELIQTHFSHPNSSALINKLMSESSNGLLKDMLPEESTTERPDTGHLTLLTGLTIQGEWSRSFTPLLTRDKPFTKEDGTTLTLPTMHRDGTYAYAEIPELNATALSIPYKSSRYHFTVLLPIPGTSVHDLEQSLSAFPCSAVLSRLSRQHVQVALPRFTAHVSVDLTAPLQQLGVSRLFDTRAELGRISSTPGLFVDSAVHKTFLDIREGGSTVPSPNFVEAVPATSRLLTPFTVDRPFVFFISDRLLSTTLVVGRKTF